MQNPSREVFWCPLANGAPAEERENPIATQWSPLGIEHARLLPSDAVYTDLDEYATRNIDRLVSPGIVDIYCPIVKPFQATENRMEH